MSIEIEVGTIEHDDPQRRFSVFAYVCEEFREQVEFVIVRFGCISVFEGKPSDARTPFQQEVVAFAQSKVTELIWDDGILE